MAHRPDSGPGCISPTAAALLTGEATTRVARGTPEDPMATLDALPLLRLPTAWPLPVVATLCMAALAGLDLVGALAAKEWAENKSAVALGLGVASFLVLFWVYASSLQYAERRSSRWAGSC